MMTISTKVSRLVEISNHNSNQVKYKIISNLKIIEYFFLLINLRIKKATVFWYLG